MMSESDIEVICFIIKMNNFMPGIVLNVDEIVNDYILKRLC